MELNQNFLYELFLLFFRKKTVLDICIENLKFHYLPTEPYKKIWKYIVEYYNLNDKIPSIGIISQAFLSDKDNKDINHILTEINNAQLIEEEEALIQLDEYIKDVLSNEFYDNFHDIYVDGRKDEARTYMRLMADKISNFSVKKENYYKKVFGDFSARNKQRILTRDNGVLTRLKTPYSIDALDDLTGGGIDVTETSCLLGRSGSGKTKFLRWQGVGACRRGYRVLHIQAEGSEQACLDGYDATWTAVLMNDIKEGSISFEKYEKLQKIITGISNKKVDIFVHAFEQFASGTMNDVRGILADCIKFNGPIDLVLIDYLERLEPGDGHKYSRSSYEGEKMRRSAIADKMKNLALEFNTRISTATQANDIPPSDWNNPEWVMTRHNVSMAKNLPDSFSYFLTFNQTSDERKKGMARLYVDKLRFSESDIIIKLYQNYQYDRFYDRTRTLEEFYK